MKRSYQKIETPVTKALKNIRNSKQISLRRLGRMMNTSESCIADRENGRVDDISDEYIRKLVTTLGYTMEDWNDFLEGRKTTYDIKQDCITLIEKLDKEKLVSVQLFLQSYAKLF